MPGGFRSCARRRAVHLVNPGTLRRRPGNCAPAHPGGSRRGSARLAVRPFLRNAATRAKPGGRVVFAVCSVLESECERVLENHVSRHFGASSVRTRRKSHTSSRATRRRCDSRRSGTVRMAFFHAASLRDAAERKESPWPSPRRCTISEIALSDLRSRRVRVARSTRRSASVGERCATYSTRTIAYCLPWEDGIAFLARAIDERRARGVASRTGRPSAACGSTSVIRAPSGSTRRARPPSASPCTRIRTPAGSFETRKHSASIGRSASRSWPFRRRSSTLLGEHAGPPRQMGTRAHGAGRLYVTTAGATYEGTLERQLSRRRAARRRATLSACVGRVAAQRRGSDVRVCCRQG